MSKRDTNKIANRLVGETSTYLLQHAYNPVDWYPWGTEALERSRKEDKPILLSIGYAACHWCHVMEHESFEDSEIAALMNEKFVNIKVDREERTDLDEIYMKAVQLMTGHGGWPMTVFLTPELKPIFAGTYFPPDDRHGMPSFRKILSGVSSAWQEKREDVLNSAQEITDHLIKFESMGELKSSLDFEACDDDLNFDIVSTAFGKIYKYFDDVFGGIGSQPKFPQPFCLELALRVLVSEHSSPEDKEKAKHFLDLTLAKMAYGGIHDHLAGGFARYSVDRKWLIPHFEKMLYDNALLASIYFDYTRVHDNRFFRQVAVGILDFVDAELSTEGGGFYSSLDADSEGIEGEFYVWTEEEIESILGEEEARFFMRNYGVTRSGNFEDGKSALHILMSPQELAVDNEMSLPDFEARVSICKKKLLDVRANRVRPGTDEKVLTSWNSLMISAFIAGYKTENCDAYLDRAKKAAQFILENLYKDGVLLRTWGAGVAKLRGYLDDYSYFVQALLDLASVDSQPLWLELAHDLTESMLNDFYDLEKGGFFYTGSEHEELIVRPRSHFDGSTPSGASVAVSNLLRLYKITGDKELLNKAKTIFSIYRELMEARPEQFGNLLTCLASYLSEGREIVLVVDRDCIEKNKQSYQELLFTVYEEYRPQDVVLLKNEAHKHRSDFKIFDGRTCLNGATTVYVCHDRTCKEPVSTVEKLRAVL